MLLLSWISPALLYEEQVFVDRHGRLSPLQHHNDI
jgi:hypothetical protein